MNSLSWLGQVLLDDDAHDFGWFSYYNREGHPDHPSPFHHWQIGLLFIFIGEAFKNMLSWLNLLGINIRNFFQTISKFIMNFIERWLYTK